MIRTIQTTAKGTPLPDLPEVCLIAMSPDGVITAANDAYCRLLGRPHDGVVGHRPAEFTHPEDVPATLARIAAGQADPHPTEPMEKRYVRPDGTTVWARVTPMWLPGEDRVLLHVLDIGDLVATRESYLDSEARLAGFVGQSASPIFALDADTRFSDANPATDRIFGRRIGEPVERVIAELVHPADRALVRAAIARLYARPGVAQPLTFRVKDGCGGWSHIECIGSNQLLDPAIRGVVVNARDVTDQVRFREQRESSLVALIESLGRTAEFRDPYTAGHQHRVSQLAAAIATRLDLEPDRVEGARLGATIHDIGKVAVPAEILSFPGKLPGAAFEMIKTHCQVGHDIVSGIEFPWPVADIILQHHERIDGTGYPNALHEDQIIVEAKVVAVADVVEAMTSHRPYRPGLGFDVALAELERQRGSKLDADVVDACTSLVSEGRFGFDDSTSVWVGPPAGRPLSNQ
jgi:PAS domain S-box-containing protein/putative nucleotidyltransferase with HDIG domain